MVSKGSKRFAELCKPHGRMLEVAAELGAQQSAVSRWASGDRTPSATWRLRIREAYGIDFAEWEQPAEAAGDAA
jgi:transcriptional regulator with XRE-family HTH domain